MPTVASPAAPAPERAHRASRASAAKQGAGRILVGVGGWSFAPWRGLFYPEGLAQSRELGYLSRALTSVEINSTFYGLQKPATFQRWHDEAPEGFLFSVKAPMFVSNRRDLASGGEGIARFLDSGVLRLGAKLGPINWQLAPGKHFDAAQIDAFLSLLPKEHDGVPLRHAIEVRHPSFADLAFVRLARRHGVAIVVAGDAKYPQIANPTAGFAYLRIMGTSDARPKGYAPAALDRWARRVRQMANGEPVDDLTMVAESTAPSATPRDVFLYVISGAKHRNPAAAQALLQRLGPDESPACRTGHGGKPVATGAAPRSRRPSGTRTAKRAGPATRR